MKKHIIINGADKQQGIEVSGIVTWWKELKTTKGEETWKFYMARATGRPYGFTMASEEAANEAFFAICEAKGMEFEKPKQEEEGWGGGWDTGPADDEDNIPGGWNIKPGDQYKTEKELGEEEDNKPIPF